MTLPFARASGPAPWPSEPAPDPAAAVAKLAAAAAAARRARLVDILWPPQDSPAKRKVGRLNRQEHFRAPWSLASSRFLLVSSKIAICQWLPLLGGSQAWAWMRLRLHSAAAAAAGAS